MPLTVKKSLQTKLFQLTNDCFKLFLTKQSGLKDFTINYYEPEIGYVLHEFEEHFYSVLLPKDANSDKQKIYQIQGQQCTDLIKKNITKNKRRDLIKVNAGDQTQPKIKYLTRSDELMQTELSLNFKIQTTMFILMEQLTFQKDLSKEFFNDSYVVF